MTDTDIDFSRLKVALIDDEPFIRKLIIRILLDIGIKDIVEADDGEDGLKKVRQIRRGLSLIICDLEMPRMDGLAFLKALRADTEVTNPNIPVLVLTGHSNEDNIYDAVQLGIHGFLSKPVSRKALESRIVSALTGDPINPAMLPGR